MIQVETGYIYMVNETFLLVLLFVIIIVSLFVIILTLKEIKGETYVLSVLEGLRGKEE